MSFLWMILAGSIAGAGARLLMPRYPAGGLLIVGIGGSIVTGLMQYSTGHSIGFGGPLMGAVILLVVYAVTAKPQAQEKTSRDDSRKVA